MAKVHQTVLVRPGRYSVRRGGFVGGAAAATFPPPGLVIPSLADIMARAPRQDNADAPLQNRTWYDQLATQTRKGY